MKKFDILYFVQPQRRTTNSVSDLDAKVWNDNLALFVDTGISICISKCLVDTAGGDSCIFNTLRPRQNGRHFKDGILKCIFFNENVWISITISLNVVPGGPISNIPSLVQIMAWRRPSAKPLSEPMMVGLPTHICVTRPKKYRWHNRKSYRLRYSQCISLSL